MPPRGIEPLMPSQRAAKHPDIRRGRGIEPQEHTRRVHPSSSLQGRRLTPTQVVLRIERACVSSLLAVPFDPVLPSHGGVSGRSRERSGGRDGNRTHRISLVRGAVSPATLLARSTSQTTWRLFSVKGWGLPEFRARWLIYTAQWGTWESNPARSPYQRDQGNRPILPRILLHFVGR